MFSLVPLKTKILDHLKLHCISVSEFEKQLCLSNSSISRLLISENRSPSLETLIKLSKALKFSLDELLNNKIDSLKNIDASGSLDNILFKQVVLYVLFFTESNSIQIQFENIQSVIRDIYNKYYKENLNFSDKTYADWYLTTYLISEAKD